MNKKTKNVIIALIVIVLALGCGSIGLVAADKHIEAVETTSISAQATQGNGEEQSNSQSDSDSNDSSEAAKDNDGKNKTESTSSAKSNTDGKKSQSSDSGKSQGNSGSSGGSGNSGSSSQSNNKTSPTTAKSQQTTPATKKTYTCTVTIDCSVLLSNMDNLTEGKEAYVPSNGYILKNYTIKAQEGETVYSLLKRVCAANGIPYNAQNTSFGTYISGINNLDEKDCGSASGWKYKVNGVYPGHTCEREKIKSNSTIVWEYVTHA